MKSVFISSIIAVTLFATANTYAATTNGGVIHFEGELVNAACAVNTESADQVVSSVNIEQISLMLLAQLLHQFRLLLS